MIETALFWLIISIICLIALPVIVVLLAFAFMFVITIFGVVVDITATVIDWAYLKYRRWRRRRKS